MKRRGGSEVEATFPKRGEVMRFKYSYAREWEAVKARASFLIIDNAIEARHYSCARRDMISTSCLKLG